MHIWAICFSSLDDNYSKIATSAQIQSNTEQPLNVWPDRY